MQIKTYDEIDPDEVYRLGMAAFGRALDEARIRKLRRVDARYMEGFAMYAVERGKVLAQVVPVRLPVRLSTGVEEVGGLQAVCSYPAVWGQGYTRRLMEIAHERFREEGLRISTLTTSTNTRGHDVYRKLGYVDLAPFYLGTRRIPVDRRASNGVRTRRATRKDLSRIHELYLNATRGLLGWTKRLPGQLVAQWGAFPRERPWYRVVVRDGQVTGSYRARPDDHIAMEDVLAASERDFLATVAAAETAARGRIATSNWITCRRDMRRFENLGYRLDLLSDSTMAMPLNDGVRARNLPQLFGGTTGRFVHYPTDDF